jgi:hypothetical protein
MNLRTCLTRPAIAVALSLCGISSVALAQSAAPTSSTKEGGAMSMGKMGAGGKMDGHKMDGDMMKGDMMSGGMMGGGMMKKMMGDHAGMMGQHVEGRIAFLKAELKITDAQTPQWNRFADVLREQAKSMNAMRDQMMKMDEPTTLPEQLDRREKMMTSHLASMKTFKDAVGPLYASFSDEQKKTADELMVGPMGGM